MTTPCVRNGFCLVGDINKANCVLISCLFVVATKCYAAATTQRPVQLGCEKNAVQISFLRKKTTSFPEVADRSLILTFHNKNIKLDNFGQLANNVHISSKSQALSYVRFHDSLYTFFYWRDRVNFEIIPTEKITKMPAYGLNRYYKVYPGGAGMAGVISSAAYNKGNFTAPKVTQEGDHFEIVRWMFVPGKYAQATVQLIREYVKPNGSYRWVTLRCMRPPKLPDTYWRVPYFA